MKEPLATPGEIAAFLRKSEKTLANWRSQGIGPPYQKVNGRVLYDWPDVRTWLAGQYIEPDRATARQPI